MYNILTYVIIYIFSIFISSMSQIMLKKAALREASSIWKEYLNPLVIGAYAIFFISTVLTIVALKGVPLSWGPMLESISYIFVTILGWYFLGEKLNKKNLVGMIVIIIGIIIYSL